MVSPFDPFRWALAHGRHLELGPRGILMAIVNVTPDSFSDGGQFDSADAAVAQAILCLEQGAEIVDPWFQKAGLKALQPYLDPENGLLDAYNSALPTSIYYDADGRELWRVVGAIDWQGAEAKALLAEAR